PRRRWANAPARFWSRPPDGPREEWTQGAGRNAVLLASGALARRAQANERRRLGLRRRLRRDAPRTQALFGHRGTVASRLAPRAASLAGGEQRTCGLLRGRTSCSLGGPRGASRDHVAGRTLRAPAPVGSHRIGQDGRTVPGSLGLRLERSRSV